MILGLLLCIPLAFGLLQLYPWRSSQRRLICFLGFLMMLVAWLQAAFQEPLILTVGNWPHFAGILWTMDSLSLVFTGVLIFLYLPTAIALSAHSSSILVLFHFLVASMMGAFLTGDLFNLFVMFEILLLSSYALLFSLRKLKFGKIFIWSNIIGSAVFLFSLSYIYKTLGTVNMADISVRFHHLPSGMQDLIFLSTSFAFLLKAGVWPLSIWMPSSYPELPTPLLAFLSALASKVGIYALVRWVSLIGFNFFVGYSHWFLLLAICSIAFSLIGAIGQQKLKNSLAYLSLSHVGFLLLALTLPQPLGLAALLLYFLQDAFGAAGMMFFCHDLERAHHPHLLFKSQAVLSSLFLIFLLASAGLPPLSGFWPKWTMLRSSITQPFFFLIILGSAFFYLYFSILVWNRYFVGEAKGSEKREKKPVHLQFGTTYCFAFIILISAVYSYKPDLFLEPAQSICDRLQYVERIQQASKMVEIKREEQKKLLQAEGDLK